VSSQQPPGSSTTVPQHKNFVRGEWVAASGSARYSTRNPARPEELLGEFADSSEVDARNAIESAASASSAWAEKPAPQQRCTAISRVIVTDAQADALVDCILGHVARIKVGDGLDPSTTMGPLVSEDQLRSVDNYVRQGIESGCALLTGGEALTEQPERQGFYYAPTVFDRVPSDSPLATEEIFGPVLPVLRVADMDEAIAIANGTRYGLAASVFTSELRCIHEFIARVKAGMIHVNHGTASQAHVPFGGVKDSGQGAYSIGPTAREFYTNAKTVYVRW
jgi:alpha-ketoglutaric semialdehyde dehydrogenase